MAELQPTYRKGIKFGAPRKMTAEDLANVEEAAVIEENFPTHRTILLTPNDGAVPIGKKVDIVVTEEVLLSTANHVAQDISKESGGFLLGNRYECPNTHRQYIIIDQFMKADYTEGTQVSLTFTTDSWAQLKDRLDGKYRGKQLVGWYHSHPGMGIFLSNYDLEIHKNRFNNEWDVALVLDPVKHEGGFFGWVDGNVNPREMVDFYELLEAESRETVVAWTNYSAEDPKTQNIAPLKPVNTQNFDGTATITSNSALKAKTVASGGLMGNPLLLIIGIATLGFFLLGTLFAGYWLFIRNKGGNETNTTTENQPVNNKVLNAERTRISKDPKDFKGYVSSENKLRIEMKISGLGETEVFEEVKKPENLEITINSQTAAIEETRVDNGSILMVRAATDLSPEAAEAFNKGTSQDLEMLVEIFYNGDAVSRKISTKYSKGKGNTDLGNVVEFGGTSDVIVTPTKTKPKVVSDNKPTEQPVQEKPQTKQQTKQTKQTKTQSTQGQGTSGGITLDADVKVPNPIGPTPKPTKNDNKKDKKKKDGSTGGSSLGNPQ